jgi:IPT/TIG domain
VSTISQAPTSGGSVTITGSNFGTNSPFVSITIGSVSCTSVTIPIANTEIVCEIGAGVGASITTEVDVGGQIATVLFSYQGK